MFYTLDTWLMGKFYVFRINVESDMSQFEPAWGTAAWFSKRLLKEGTSEPTAYFSYKSNGYQLFRHSRLIKVLVESGNLFLKNSRLVDIGCATGYLSNKIAHTIDAKMTVAIDFSSSLLEEGKKYFPLIKFKKGSLPDLPLENDCADILSLIEVLYYVEKKKRIDSLHECSRLLKDEGIFIFTANVSGEPYLTLNEVDTLFSKTSFKVEKRYLEHYWLLIHTEGALLRLYRLCDLVLSSNISKPGSGRAERYAYYLRNPPGRLLTKAGKMVSTKLIGSRVLMSGLAAINRMFPIGGVTHIIIIAIKK